MPLIEWTERLATGVGRFDEQHRRLIAILNELHAAMGAGRGNEAIGQALEELIAYTVSHFADEEKLMAQAAYPMLASHKLEHKALTDRVLDLQNKFGSGKVFITVEVLNFLRDWLNKHIQGTDKQYGPVLVKKGLGRE